ncbi:histone H4 transcription factor isoform X2 [Lingula anatina]|uniref:Histone H4 transcription factor isoform X1 n=1 Tax=Lingula anatina TaxID=7574 RepID=A0A1S3GYG4_LINAN|nr:histone H4 transcription factor isoform X1 [Lingula anatina]XP_013378916.1 histone H4 transcription factor isoform X2 [Lingula anatina]|eukprot:XP_013378915.1 histone H4 transcription factor isoform X1 [Lingula anatina]
MPPKKKLKRQIQPPHKNDPLTLSCEWGTCEDVFDNMDDFLKHVLDHLNHEFIAERSQAGQAPVLDVYKPSKCKWRECGYLAERDHFDYLRHTYFHCFHVKIKCFGMTMLLQSESKQGCMLDSATRNMIPELPERLQCGWKECEEISDNPEYFYRHVAFHAEDYPEGNNVPGGCRCEWEGCGHSYKSKHKLKEHLRSHTQQKVVACPTCGGLFSNRTKFFDHVKRQSQADPHCYQCSHCNKRFNTERLLRDHMRNHVNHYKCPLCDMTCPAPSALRNHIRYRHTNEKPYKCTGCERKCKTLADLRKHLETHNEKPMFYCHYPNCKYSAKVYNLFVRHFRKHTANPMGIKPKYMCHICNTTYTRGEKLTHHLKNHHKFKWPSGHTRFRYKLHEDSFFRLQTVRYESIELTEHFLEKAPERRDEDEEEVTVEVIPEDCTDEEGQGDAQEEVHPDDMSYNLDVLGDAALRELNSKQTDSETAMAQPTQSVEQLTQSETALINVIEDQEQSLEHDGQLDDVIHSGQMLQTEPVLSHTEAHLTNSLELQTQSEQPEISPSTSNTPVTSNKLQVLIGHNVHLPETDLSTIDHTDILEQVEEMEPPAEEHAGIEVHPIIACGL